MKIVYNKLIPFKGFVAINLFGICFVRKEYEGKLSKSKMSKMINHENIHTEQMKEMLYIFFYLWYFIEWIINIFRYGTEDAYEMISFEREAYRNANNKDYLKNRKHYSWVNFLKENID